MKSLTQMVFLFSVLLAPYIAGAQNPGWIYNVTNGLLNVVFPIIVALLSALAVLFFVWGVVVFIAQTDNEQARAEGKQRMIWGIVALFVLVSVWGLVILLQDLTGADGAGITPPAPQTSYLLLQDNYYL